MKPQQLRLGNLLYVPGLFGTSTLVESVESINANGEIGTKSTEAHASCYEPIELTEEWLLKFGFEIEKSSSHCIAFNEVEYEHELQLDKEFGTTENCWNITKYGGRYRLIYYVHQLQNLFFALTGEELKIKES